jgi:hypothetical protein
LSRLLALQGAQLWNHGQLESEEIPEMSSLWECANHSRHESIRLCMLLAPRSCRVSSVKHCVKRCAYRDSGKQSRIHLIPSWIFSSCVCSRHSFANLCLWCTKWLTVHSRNGSGSSNCLLAASRVTTRVGVRMTSPSQQANLQQDLVSWIKIRLYPLRPLSICISRGP